MHDDEKKKDDLDPRKFGFGMVLGMAVGVAIGVALGNIAVGVGVGAGIGTALGIGFAQATSGKDDAST